MKKALFLLILSLSIFVHSQEPPKLVIGIVVDQMKQDYLLRYYSRFTEGGFKRIMNEGFQFKNAHYNYIPTVTAPGHSSIFTGTTPSVHGIIGNDWFSRSLKRSMYCALDTTVSGVGGIQSGGQRSPRNLQSSTITDELLLSTNFRSKIVGIALKDRGAIFPAGHNPTGAYWYEETTGNFMTSSYYMQELPKWVVDFNNKKLTNKYLDQVWETLLPIASYTESTADLTPYEKPLNGQINPTFPYDLKQLSTDGQLKIIKATPFGNSIVMDLAFAAMTGEKLGKGTNTDFLTISFSSTDHAGHDYGPHSIEIQDMYLRLDLEIKRLLDYLDKTVKGEYLVFLTSDHGASPVPQLLIDNKMAGGYVTSIKPAKVVQALQAHFGDGDWIQGISYGQIYLNHELIKEKGLDRKKVQATLREVLLQFDEVQEVFLAEELSQRVGTSWIRQMAENGFHTKLSGDVSIVLKPGFSNEKAPAGTGHGSGYAYDTHVPILFFGKNITKGFSVRQVAVTDISSTLSMLLNISLPSGNTGEPLKELFE